MCRNDRSAKESRASSPGLERLLREFAGKVPQLVFVGKWGWDIDDLRVEIEGSNDLDGHLTVLNAASDAELAFLYDHCLFTAYASFAEGFGLPGRREPCPRQALASPRIRPRFPKWGATLRVISILATKPAPTIRCRPVVQSPPALAEWTAKVAAGYHAKSWRSFTDESSTHPSILPKRQGRLQQQLHS